MTANVLTQLPVNGTLVQTLKHNRKDLQRITRSILIETGIRRYLPFTTARHTKLNDLLDVEISLYHTITACLHEKAGDFEHCREELTQYLDSLTERLQDRENYEEQPVAEQLPEQLRSEHVTERVRAQEQLRTHRLKNADYTARVQREEAKTANYENKLHETDCLLDIVVNLHNQFTTTAERVEQEEEHLQATVNTFKQLIELQPLSKVLRHMGSDIRRITLASYDAVHHGVQNIEHAVNSIHLPRLTDHVYRQPRVYQHKTI